MPDHGLHTDNVTPCGGHDNEDDGCQTTFRRTSKKHALCKKCIALQAPMSEIDKERIVVCGSYFTALIGVCLPATGIELDAM